MKLRSKLGLQMSDLLVYIIIPFASMLMPAGLSRGLIGRVAAWNWVLRSEAEASLSHAMQYTRIVDVSEWKRRWRTVILLDARDLSLLTMGRGKAVLNEISGRERISLARDRVLIGMHWGPAISILHLLKREQMKPLIVYREEDRAIMKSRPFYYVFLRKAVRYIQRSCGERAVMVGGASNALRKMLPMSGTSIVVLDAPPTPGRTAIDGTVLGQSVQFNAGFPEILQESGRQYLYYAISLRPGQSALKTLDLTAPRHADSTDDMVSEYCEFLSQHLSDDSAQWRIWQVADQFFKPTAETPPDTAAIDEL